MWRVRKQLNWNQKKSGGIQCRNCKGKNKAIQQKHKEKRGSVNAGVRGCLIASGVAENQREQTGEVKE